MKNIINKIDFDKTYYYSLLVFAFALPLSRATNSFFTILLIVLLFLQSDYKKHFMLIKQSKASLGILAFLAFATLSILWSEDKLRAIDFMRNYWQWFAIFAIALNVKADQIKDILSAFIFGMFLSEMLVYGIYFEFWSINGASPSSPSPFMMHMDYSVLLAFTAMILLNRLLSDRYTKKQKLFMFVFFITVAGNLFINKGRTGQLGFLVAIFVAVFIHYRVNIKSILASILLAGVIFTLAYNVSPNFKQRAHQASSDIKSVFNGNYETSWGLRVAQYFVAGEIFLKNPLIGVGVGDWNSATKESLQRDNHGFSKFVIDFIPRYHSHNQYLEVLIQEGLVGLVLLFLMFYYLFKMSIDDKELSELRYILITLFMVSFVGEPLWMKQFTNVMFILLVGLILGASFNAKKNNN